MTQTSEPPQGERDGAEPTCTGGATTSKSAKNSVVRDLPSSSLTFASAGTSSHTHKCDTCASGRKRTRLSKSPLTVGKTIPQPSVEGQTAQRPLNVDQPQFRVGSTFMGRPSTQPHDVHEYEYLFNKPELEGIKMPLQFPDYLAKSLEEYKKLATLLEKSKTFLKDLIFKKDQEIFPNSLRIKPPKLKISDENINKCFQEKMAGLCNQYKIGLLDAYIDAQKTLVDNQTRQVSDYPKNFESRISDMFAELCKLEIIDTRDVTIEHSVLGARTYSTNDLWRNTCNKWQQNMLRDFRRAVNDFKLEQFLQAQNDQNAQTQRVRARDQAMEDADNLPREETIADLVKKAIDNKVLPILTRCEKLIKERDIPPPAEQPIQAQRKPNGKQVHNSTPARKNRTKNNVARGNTSQGQHVRQDQGRVNANLSDPGNVSTRKGKEHQREQQKPRAGPKNGRRPELTKDGGTTPCTPSTARVSSSKPYRYFRRSGSEKNPNNSAPPNRGSSHR